jgi:hypothetical protein
LGAKENDWPKKSWALRKLCSILVTGLEAVTEYAEVMQSFHYLQNIEPKNS